jgi:predicted ATPase
MEYKFYIKRLDSIQPEIEEYPAFLLTETTWDDFHFKTSFMLHYYKSPRNKTEIGTTKILQKDQLITKLNPKFNKLNGKYCSLGQDNSYYENLKAHFNITQITSILDALNDITYSKGIVSEFENLDGFSKSLLRFSEAQKACNEAIKIIYNIPIINSFKFSFTTTVKGFDDDHSVNFKFSNSSKIPKRLVAFVGKNGSGKTQVLSRLASSLSGFSKKGNFNTEYLPPFSRVIAVSYSLFDKFEKPQKTKSFSYFYCGLQSGRSERKLQSEIQIERRIRTALKSIVMAPNNEEMLFYNYIKELLGSEVADRIIDDMGGIKKDFRVYDDQDNSTFSSGQIILILLLAEIVANIRKESLLLFDEPETHLHPNAISKLVGIIYKILKRFDSYAIIATHSPQIIQEIPSSSIYIFSNSTNGPPSRKADYETFGENLTTLTEKIFQTVDVDEYYKSVLKSLSKQNSAQEILNLFKKEGKVLSLNARIYLESLY